MERIDQWIEREQDDFPTLPPKGRPDPYWNGDYPLPCCGRLANEHDYPLAGGVLCPTNQEPTNEQ